MARIERLRDGQIHDGISEELEPFVVAARGVRVLMEPR
jgi:hypothetical protein